MATIRIHEKTTIDKEITVYNVEKLELQIFLDDKIKRECPAGYHYKKTVRYRIIHKLKMKPYIITAYVRVRFEKNKN